MVLVYRVPLLNPFRRRRRRRRFRERERERKCSTRRQFAKKLGNAVSKGRFFFPSSRVAKERERERERERDAPYFLRPRPGLRRDELFQVSDGIVLVALHAYFLPEAVVEDHFDHDDHDHHDHHHHDVSTKRVVSTIEASSSFTSSSSFCPSQSLLLLLSENE